MHFVIIGAGAIGMEFGYFYSSYGSDVTIVEYMDQVLPNEDKDVAAEVQKDFKRKKVNILTNTGAQQVNVGGTHNAVPIEVGNRNALIVVFAKLLHLPLQLFRCLLFGRILGDDGSTE